LNQCSQGDRAQKAHPITSALKKTKSAAQLTTFITRNCKCCSLSRSCTDNRWFNHSFARAHRVNCGQQT